MPDPATPEKKPSNTPPPRTPLFEAHALGQSIWLDNISRNLLLCGGLHDWTREKGIRGVTSNPSIFEKAIAGTADYDPSTRALIAQGASDALDVFERLAVTDIQLGCDVLRPIWEESGGRDGFVSLEVSPHLANDTEGTIAEAHRLAGAVMRENLMIKVPATPEGIPAIQTLISDGLNINVTLLFAIDAYEAVHQAYLAGLEERLERGEPISGIASVASFFISRIDVAVGRHLQAALEAETRPERRARLEALDARVAIANAKLAYARFLETLASDRWNRLAAAGAHPQRVLWASTGTKDPALPRTLYVDELIGKHTVNTLPDATLAAFLEEGRVRDALGEDPEALTNEARAILSELDALGISLKEITDELLTKGCALFSDAFDSLLLSVETKRQQLLGPALPKMSESLGDLAAEVDATRRTWHEEGQSRRLWQRDASLFTNSDEANWMGWLDLPRADPESAVASEALREIVRTHDSETAVVLGMGGSSLWPDVLGRTFAEFVTQQDPPANETTATTCAGRGSGRARALRVIDTTVPDAIGSILEELDLERCLFFVSSKSGSTIEPNALFALIHARLVDRVGEVAAGRHFVAITDPGSDLERLAREKGFLGVACGRPDVGGRFSALSPFGLLPAEAMGLDPRELQARARSMAAACAPFVSPDRNPGVALGTILGTLARGGRDKLTLTTSPAIASFPDWIEQLIAESTGKNGKGIIPIIGEGLHDPGRYAADRIFVDLAVAGDPTNADRQARLARLEEAGHPVLRIELADPLDLVQEVFRWEMATAVSGALLGLNPFDQPDVEAAKIASRELMEKAAETGGLPVPMPDLDANGIRFFVGSAFSAEAGRTTADPVALLKALFERLDASDTFLLNAFLEDAPEIRTALESIRAAVAEARPVATTLDFGPRYLHSTGQLQKGGPARFAGLQLWQGAAARKKPPLGIPGMSISFDTLAEAQAIGDFSVLCERGRRMIGIDVGPDPAAALSRVGDWVREALA
ncbi:MAG TPA: bifunctional transaldolase/phosoglucose isomerase [Deltaproteobacteria bacterium]|nr:bifunctional transaldolase/phosoglucose isomerase [Deltaproteobacteria bacterium]